MTTRAGLWSAATVLTGFAPNFLFVLGTRVVMGMGESTSWPASNRIIREWFPASERGLANAIFGAGATIGAVAISYLVAAYGWRTGFVAAGSVGFVWLLVWVLLFDQPERVRWLGATERQKILRERDGNRESTIITGSSLAYPLLRQRSVWGLFFTQGPRSTAADLAAVLSAG